MLEAVIALYMLRNFGQPPPWTAAASSPVVVGLVLHEGIRTAWVGVVAVAVVLVTLGNADMGGLQWRSRRRSA
ncbi:hypothetical protein [Nocardia tengchongensis]|uniref:hypothetical protein n=1 Tax=Nocardia tengchongensis TaxID=2055889 RepID=UPI00361E96FC